MQLGGIGFLISKDMMLNNKQRLVFEMESAYSERCFLFLHSGHGRAMRPNFSCTHGTDMTLICV